jgi:dolichol-phosphate mannosyltransferase
MKKLFNLNKNSFTIVLPVLNEEKNIKELILLINKYLKNHIFEIIFVDDNSSDKTADVIRQNMTNNVKYFLRKNNRDLTLSCFFGIKNSKYKNIIIMDSDLQHNPKYLPKMISLYFKKDYDFLIGTRNFDLDGSLSFVRYFFSKFLIFFYNLCLKPTLRDPMSGFFIFKKDIYLKNKKKLFGRGFKILADLVYNKHNVSIKEYLIKFESRKNNNSKMNYTVLLNVLKLLIFKIYFLYIKR